MLEVLLSITLCVIVASAGTVAMFQILGVSGGLYPANQLQEVELSRLLLEIERDFATADRAYVWNSQITENGGPLTSITLDNLSVTDAGSDANIWNLAVPPTDDADFYADWRAANGNIGSVACDANDYYYTLVLLGGPNTINAVVYLTVTQLASPQQVKYTLVRYANIGAAPLMPGQTFSYTAPGASFTASDQSATTTTFPSITRNGTSNSIVIRFPTAFSTALKDITSGKQSRRVKYTADAWGVWTLSPANGTGLNSAGRWY